jgi:LysR family glycine cleavage system transcriptional activator
VVGCIASATFTAAHPEIDLRVSATDHHVDFRRARRPMSRFATARALWPWLDAVRLSTEQLFVVCSPKLMAGRGRLRKPADVLKFPLLPPE